MNTRAAAPEVPPFERGGGFGTLGSSFEQPHLPTPEPWTPSTAGAYVTLCLLCAAGASVLLLGIRRYRRRRPRRVALRQLASLERGSSALPELAVLLKLVALDSFGRVPVASLHGERWRQFLITTRPGAGFEGLAGDALVLLCERGPSAVPATAVEPLFAATQAWIRKHAPAEAG
jgi:hypothetical protein